MKSFKSSDFQMFIDVNFLKKKDVAEYLSVSTAFITQLSQGLRDIPLDKLALLKQNPKWDTSMLGDFEMLKPSQRTEGIPNKSADSITIPREVFDQISRLTETVLSQQRTIEQLTLFKKEDAQEGDSVASAAAR